MYKLKTIGKKASYFSSAEKFVALAENAQRSGEQPPDLCIHTS
ncbi:MAG: hypothetical protein ACOY90_07780 [Candidatus Zhuqueibacterota bacterium]